MSTHIAGVRDLDGKFADMIKVKEACDIAKIDYPIEVQDFFRGEAQQSVEYLQQEMEEINLDNLVQKNKVPVDMTDTFEIPLSLIPKEVKVIRFKNCY